MKHDEHDECVSETQRFCRDCVRMAEEGRSQNAADRLFVRMTDLRPDGEAFRLVLNTRRAVCEQFSVI